MMARKNRNQRQTSLSEIKHNKITKNPPRMMRLPVTLTEFKKHTNCREVGERIIKQSVQNNGVHTSNARLARDRIIYKLYYDFYTNPHFRKSGDIKLKPCPRSLHDQLLKMVGYSNTEIKSEKDSNDNSPTAPNQTSYHSHKDVGNISDQKKIQESNEERLHFPVSFRKFKKFTNIDEIIDQQLIEADHTKESKEQRKYDLYKRFYSNAESREDLNIVISACPTYMKRKLLEFSTVSTDIQDKKRSRSLLGESIVPNVECGKSNDARSLSVSQIHSKNQSIGNIYNREGTTSAAPKKTFCGQKDTSASAAVATNFAQKKGIRKNTTIHNEENDVIEQSNQQANLQRKSFVMESESGKDSNIKRNACPPASKKKLLYVPKVSVESPGKSKEKCKLVEVGPNNLNKKRLEVKIISKMPLRAFAEKQPIKNIRNRLNEVVQKSTAPTVSKKVSYENKNTSASTMIAGYIDEQKKGIQKKTEAHAEVRFPVSFKSFKKFTNVDEIIDKNLIEDGETEESKERRKFNLYQRFYLNPESRTDSKILLKSCPTFMKNKLLDVAKDQNKEGSELVEVNPISKIPENTEIHEVASNTPLRAHPKKQTIHKRLNMGAKDTENIGVTTPTVMNRSSCCEKTVSCKRSAAIGASIEQIELQESSEAHRERKIHFPVSFSSFKKFTNIDAIINKNSIGDDESEESKEQRKYELYERFCLNPESRKNSSVLFNLCPALMKRKLLDMAQVITDSQSQPKMENILVEVEHEDNVAARSQSPLQRHGEEQPNENAHNRLDIVVQDISGFQCDESTFPVTFKEFCDNTTIVDVVKQNLPANSSKAAIKNYAYVLYIKFYTEPRETNKIFRSLMIRYEMGRRILTIREPAPISFFFDTQESDMMEQRLISEDTETVAQDRSFTVESVNPILTERLSINAKDTMITGTNESPIKLVSTTKINPTKTLGIENQGSHMIIAEKKESPIVASGNASISTTTDFLNSHWSIGQCQMKRTSIQSDKNKAQDSSKQINVNASVEQLRATSSKGATVLDTTTAIASNINTNEDIQLPTSIKVNESQNKVILADTNIFNGNSTEVFGNQNPVVIVDVENQCSSTAPPDMRTPIPADLKTEQKSSMPINISTESNLDSPSNSNEKKLIRRDLLQQEQSDCKIKLEPLSNLKFNLKENSESFNIEECIPGAIEVEDDNSGNIKSSGCEKICALLAQASTMFSQPSSLSSLSPPTLIGEKSVCLEAQRLPSTIE